MKQPKTQIKPRSKNKYTDVVYIPAVKGHPNARLEISMEFNVPRRPNWEADRIYKWLNSNLSSQTYDQLLKRIKIEMETGL